jgi:hypothetical protein
MCSPIPLLYRTMMAGEYNWATANEIRWWARSTTLRWSRSNERSVSASISVSPWHPSISRDVEKNWPQGTQTGYTHIRIGSGKMLCVLLITLPRRTSRVRLREQSQLNPSPHQQIRIKIPIKGVECTNLTNKRGKTNQTIVEGVI